MASDMYLYCFLRLICQNTYCKFGIYQELLTFTLWMLLQWYWKQAMQAVHNIEAASMICSVREVTQSLWNQVFCNGLTVIYLIVIRPEVAHSHIKVSDILTKCKDVCLRDMWTEVPDQPTHWCSLIIAFAVCLQVLIDSKNCIFRLIMEKQPSVSLSCSSSSSLSSSSKSLLLSSKVWPVFLSCFIAPDKALFITFFFLLPHKSICCWYSLEAPLWGASNEYPQHMFSCRCYYVATPSGAVLLLVKTKQGD